MTDDPENLEQGAIIAGRYRVQRQLGHGGTGTVYEVQDERAARALALKLLHLRRAGSASTALFEREYHTLCQLAHPRIIEVFDYGVEAGRAFYTMELLDGHDLQSLAPMPWRRACALLCDVASSLAIIHSRRLVHRDVSARNVRCTADERAKLLDFGAMVPMGIGRQVMGTPPYLAPEVLEMQGLDGRSDLYALGALAYFVLTGYHAYEARNLTDLRAIWACPPLLPSQYTAGIPQALDTLVMELLQLERAARPSSAAEVMERLSGIAGLPLIELPEVQRSYLLMPSLVGREAELRTARELLAEMPASGRGAALCVEGDAGVGRSRCLDACVLEARLLGALVLRGDSADSVEAGEYGVLRALCKQLWQADPDACERVGQRRAAELSFLLPELGGGADANGELPPSDAPDGHGLTGSTAPQPAPERRAVLAAAQQLLLDVARGRPILIAIDDCHAIDEPSAALLGMLARAAKQRPILLIATLLGDAGAGPALTVLRDAATRLALAPLDPEQSEALLRSVFGDAAHIAGLAAAFFEITRGNPRATMTLAEDLIERGLARYEAGHWSLPAALQARDLPRSVSDALLDRLNKLSEDARELAETLALLDPTTLGIDQYPALVPHADHARFYRALDELLAAGVLIRVGERCRFAQAVLAERLEHELPEERRRMLHERLATALQAGPIDARVARHRLLGGDERTAIEQLREAYVDEWWVDARELGVLLAALDAAKRLGTSLEIQLELHGLLLGAASSAGRRDLFFTEGTDALLHHCQRDSGVLDYLELPGTWDPAQRVEEALRRAEARYQAQPEPQRGLSPARIANTVTRVLASHNIMASIGQDLELIERVPRLDPMFAAFPLWEPIVASIQAQRWLQEGRSTKALEGAAALLAWLDRSRDARLDPGICAALRASMLYLIASFAATGGDARVGALVAEFEQHPGLRSNAWRVRMVYELVHGNMAAAADCQRRAELLNLQHSSRLQLPGTTTRTELLAHMYAENLLGVKHVMERVAELAVRFPGWRPTLAIARCHYRRLQGDAAGGLAELEPALQTAPGRHLDWWLIAYSHIKVLCDLDRCAEAVESGERYLQIWRDAQLSSVDYGLQQVLAEALMRTGHLEEARSMIDRYIEAHQQHGTRGLRLGLAYETAARIAMAAGDEFAVTRYTALCTEEYKGGRDLLLKAKLERLLREAEDYDPTASKTALAAH